ncbi:MAG TPA: cytochrome c oxidase subunit II [Gemmatimonadota bacterium]|nr:cytochrome c oxidase subunit II [Gemmatimonadota bacterium]
MRWDWILSEPVSNLGAEIDSIYYLILIITGFIFVVVEVALVWFLIRYRRRDGRRAEYSHGNKTAEVVWTVIPFVLVLYIAYASNGVWLKAKLADREGGAPADAIPMRVMAKQFEWNVTYPGPDGRLDTEDDFVVRNQLHMPVDRAVRIELGSEDVIHSFFLPDLRVKQDAVPGMVIPVWFEATKSGEYPWACAELCGLGHYRMRATVTVHETAEFEQWQASQGTPAAARVAPADTTGSQPTTSDSEESA